MSATDFADIHGVCQHFGGGSAKDVGTHSDERCPRGAKDRQKQTNILSGAMIGVRLRSLQLGVAVRLSGLYSQVPQEPEMEIRLGL